MSVKKDTISLTIDVEEWFHTKLFDSEKIINKYYKGKYPKTDIVSCIERIINIFKKYNVNSTFFLLGETAEKYPELISLINKNNHEIACHCYYHNKSYDSIHEFKKDIVGYKKKIFSDVIGFRSPNFSNLSQKRLKVLCEENFRYDSSIVPCRKIPGWYGNPQSPLHPYDIIKDGYRIREFPLAVFPIMRLPGGGGWYLRNIGMYWIKNTIKLLLKRIGIATIYLHPWEVSDENPRLKEIPHHVFRNSGQETLHRLERIIKYFNNAEYESLSRLIDRE